MSKKNQFVWRGKKGKYSTSLVKKQPPVANKNMEHICCKYNEKVILLFVQIVEQTFGGEGIKKIWWRKNRLSNWMNKVFKA